MLKHIGNIWKNIETWDRSPLGPPSHGVLPFVNSICKVPCFKLRVLSYLTVTCLKANCFKLPVNTAFKRSLFNIFELQA